MSYNLPAPSPDRTDKPKRISASVREAIASIVTGETRSITAAAEKVD